MIPKPIAPARILDLITEGYGVDDIHVKTGMSYREIASGLRWLDARHHPVRGYLMIALRREVAA